MSKTCLNAAKEHCIYVVNTFHYLYAAETGFRTRRNVASLALTPNLYGHYYLEGMGFINPDLERYSLNI